MVDAISAPDGLREAGSAVESAIHRLLQVPCKLRAGVPSCGSTARRRNPVTPE